MKKRYLFLLIILVIIAGAVLILTDNHIEANYIEGRLLSYEKYDDFILYTDPESFKELDGPTYFSMDKNASNDLFEYPEKYSSFLIALELTNTSNKKIYDVKAVLANEYKNLWFDTASFSESPLNLKANETYETNLFVIIKTEDMSVKEINKLIKSIKLEINASNLNWGFDVPLSTKEIGFDD